MSRSLKRLFGGLLMGVGGLIAGLSGLCTGGFILTGIVSAVTSAGYGTGGAPATLFGSVAGFSAMALVIGVVPIAVGVGLFVAGRGLYRSPPPPSQD